MQLVQGFDVNEVIQGMEEERALYKGGKESLYSTVTQGGKAHRRIKKLHHVITEACAGDGMVKIEYKRGFKYD